MAKGNYNRNTRQKATPKGAVRGKGNARSLNKPNRNDSVLQVVLLFGAALLIHALLNMLVNKAPRFIIDEGLYTNIARSLAWDGELAFRGQPINYPYLLYPFSLVPVFWLNRLFGGDVYRYVQIFNTILITSSVFPAYFFARDFTKDHSKAFITALLVSLMPDMLMGSCEMTESLIWPLALWMVFFCYRFYTNHRTTDGLLAALFAGLMFACKPGAIAMGAALLLIYLILAIKRRQHILRAFGAILLLAAIVGAVYGVYLAFYHGWDTLLGLYEKQTAGWKGEDALVACEAFFLTVFLFVFASGGLFAIFPYTHLSEYEPGKRAFIISAAIGILAAIAGTAIFVVPYQWSGGYRNLPLHLRYCSMYIPLMYVFAVDMDRCQKKSKSYIVALIAFMVLSVFPGVRAGFVTGDTAMIDSVTLSAFINTRNVNGNVTGWVATALALVFSGIFLYNAIKQKSFTQKQNRVVFEIGNLFLILFFLFNAVCAHVCAYSSVDPTIAADAAEVNRIIGSERCLGVTQRHYADVYSYYLDGRLNVPMQQVTSDQMFVEMQKTNGVYIPFVPQDQVPNVNNHETTDTDTFVLGMTIAEHLELSEDVRSVTKTANGHFTVVEIDRENRWVDTMLYGLDDNSLYPGETGYLQIFDGDRNIDGTLSVSIVAAGEGTLNVNGNRVAVELQAKTYEFSIPYSEMVPIVAEDGVIQIFGYTTQKPSDGR